MYQFRLSNIGKELESKANWIALIALCIALLAIAVASILIAIAETEITPNAITCDRLLIAAVAFSIWNTVKVFNQDNLNPTLPSQPAYSRAIALLLIDSLAKFSSGFIAVSMLSIPTNCSNFDNATLCRTIEFI